MQKVIEKKSSRSAIAFGAPRAASVLALATLGLIGSMQSTAFAQNGHSGASGYDGSPGRDSVLFPDGRQVALDLRGQDGSPGGNGGNGYPGSSCQFWGQFRADSGGNGGPGGRGGNGGSGGDLTVYSSNVEKLKSIFVDSSGGRGAPGGEGGMGAPGGYGRTFTRQVCRTVQPQPPRPGQPRPPTRQVCHMEAWTCHAGYNGNHGYTGSYGSNGSFGFLRYIPRDQVLPAEHSSEAVVLSTLQPEGNFTLTKDIWETRSGATQLLAPGSVISDQYSQYVQTNARDVKVLWSSVRPVEQLGSHSLSLAFDGNKVSAAASSGLLLDMKGQVDATGNAHFAINRAMTVSELDAVTLARLSGSGSDFTIELKDAFQFPDWVNTSVRVYLERDRSLWSDAAFFNEDVTALVERKSDGTLVIPVGTRTGNNKFLKRGKRVSTIIEVKRKFLATERTVRIERTFHVGE